jgi:predicted transposase YbfD/YdcC
VVAHVRKAVNFDSIELILRIDTQVTAEEVAVRSETRYKIGSISSEKVSSQGLMHLIRGHWGVENELHFLNDRWRDEDRQWSKRVGLAERIAMLRDSALTALRLFPNLPEDLPIRARADHFSRKLTKALRFIGAFN